MLRLSINLLTSIMSMMRNAIQYDAFTLHEDVVHYQSYSVSTDAMTDMAEACHWVTCSRNSIYLTEQGSAIISNFNYGLDMVGLRMMLKDYILCVQPIWRNRIPYGRQEATIFMSKDEKACFAEAGLLNDNPSPDVVAWWDSLSSDIRKASDESKTNTGRVGEQLTIEYEKIRTGKIPQWVSIDSNLAGFDVMSVLDADDLRPLMIEVKTSLKTDDAVFFVTKNECMVASGNVAYKLYLWDVSSNEKKLAILSFNDIERYIPINQNEGEWEIVKIPFAPFANKFRTTTL